MCCGARGILRAAIITESFQGPGHLVLSTAPASWGTGLVVTRRNAIWLIRSSSVGKDSVSREEDPSSELHVKGKAIGRTARLGRGAMWGETAREDAGAGVPVGRHFSKLPTLGVELAGTCEPSPEPSPNSSAKTR
jgi:hypothetical protein